MLSKSTKRFFWLTICVLSALLLSLIRENTFLIINGIINGQGSYKANTTPPQWLINNFTVNQLIGLKWPLTLVFCSLFMFLTIFAVRRFFDNRQYIRIVKMLYLALLTIGGLLFILYYTLSLENESVTYRYLHLILATLQSPIMLLIFIPVFSAKEQVELLSKKQ
jgi:hypothetical protein